MEIIRANSEHIENILDITKKAFAIYKRYLSADIKLKALEETFSDVLYDIENNHVFVGILDGKTAGCIRLKKLSDDITYIYRFSVDPEIHKAGLGTELCEYAVKFSETLNAKAVTLHSNSKNSELTKFYYNKGFYIHSVDLSRGYSRALFVRELNSNLNLTEAFKKIDIL